MTLMADLERKLTELLHKVMDENKKKELTNNYKKPECMVVCKRDGPSCELITSNVKLEQVQKFNNLISIVRDDGKYKT